MPRKSDLQSFKGTPEESSATLDPLKIDVMLYYRAQAFYRAAKSLMIAFTRRTVLCRPEDAIPIIVLYRRAAELYLKAVILGHGSSFLSERPVIARFQGPRSLTALVALACQILESVGWDRFKTELVPNLGDLRKTIAKVETIYTSTLTLRDNSNQQTLATILREFAKPIGAALDILDAAADALSKMHSGKQ